MQYLPTVGYSTPAQPNRPPPLNLRRYIPFTFGVLSIITLSVLFVTIFSIVRFGYSVPVYALCALSIWLFREWARILFGVVLVSSFNSQPEQTPLKSRKSPPPPDASKVIPIDLEQKSVINPDFGG